MPRTARQRSVELDAFRTDPDVIVYEALERGDVMRIRREIEGRQWARAHGLPSAQTVAVGPGDRWLVSRRVADVPGESLDYVVAAFELADRIGRLDAPRFLTRGADWRAPRWSVLPRAVRLAKAGVDPGTFLALRRAATTLPHEVTVHNDFHRDNVLNSQGTDPVTVIDWEFTSRGPRHHDQIRLIVDIIDDGLALAAWELLLSSAPVAEHPAMAAQLRWLALRTYASEVVVPVIDAAKARRRWSRWQQARVWTHGVR